MAATKAGTTVDIIQELAQNTVLEGATNDISDSYNIGLLLWLALTTATAHTGTQIVVQVSNQTSGDEDWADLCRFIALIGTANLEVITNNPLAAAATTITVADTTGYVTALAWLFLEDVSTFADSEFVMQKAYVTNTSVTVVDGVAREHAVNSILNNVAGSWVVALPNTAQRVRVLYNNCYDADGSTIALMSVIGELTGV